MEINVTAVRLAMADKGMTLNKGGACLRVYGGAVCKGGRQRYAYDALQDWQSVGRQAVQLGAGSSVKRGEVKAWIRLS